MPRDTLTQDQIVQAAVELLDAEGLEGLSMRRLGKRLDAAATAVYWHVNSKDKLVALAADATWSEIPLPDLGAVDWQAAATTMAGGLYAMILRHHWLLAAMSTQPIYGPGKARHDDHLLAVYEAAGFTSQDADNASQTVFTFVLGSALGVTSEVAWRARLRRQGGNEEEQLQATVAQVREIAMQFPRLRTRLQAWEAADPAAPPHSSPDPGFAFGLQAILDGLQARRPRSAEPAPG